MSKCKVRVPKRGHFYGDPINCFLRANTFYIGFNIIFLKILNRKIKYFFSNYDYFFSLSLNKQEINELDLDSISKNSLIGYFLEVDLEYPSELHDSHNDYPMALEKLEISSNKLSKYCFLILLINMQ